MDDGERVSVTPTGACSADVRICSPDATGFGCDLARTMFDFGLVVERGDFSTDGKWSFLMFKVRPGNGLDSCSWALLKQRLEAVCPSDPSAAKQKAGSARSDAPRQHFIFQVEVTDRVGLLHDVTQALWERELTVHRAHVSTSPSDHAVDLFYVTGAWARLRTLGTALTLHADNRNELPSSERFKDVQDHVRATLGDPSSKFSLYPAPVTNCRCAAAIPCDGTICGGRRLGEGGEEEGEDAAAPRTGAARSNAAAAAAAALEATMEDVEDPTDARASGYAEAVVTVDNYTSKAHTVLQVRTRDRKGLFYDSMRATKDLKVNVSYGKVEVRESGICELDLFVGRTSSQDVERRLCQRLRRAIERPLEVGVTGKGIDAVTTELCVTAPMDAGGHARPRVLLDVTNALRRLGIMVFKADIHTARIQGKPLQEVHRFLLTDAFGQPIDDPSMRDRVVKMVRSSLLD